MKEMIVAKSVTFKRRCSWQGMGRFVDGNGDGQEMEVEGGKCPTDE
jgi:hypothetical protein